MAKLVGNAGQLSLQTCADLVEAASRTCRQPQPTSVPDASKVSSSDALAAVAAAIANATLGLAILTLCAAIGWLFYVRHRTKIEAQKEAEKVVPVEVRAYLESRLQGMIAEALAPILSSQGQPQTPAQQEEGLREDDR